jgi:hypothetical protein
MKNVSSKHCTICGWMVKKYGLSGISLMIYAILYSTSQDEFSCPVNWDFIKICTGLKPSESELILKSFKDRGMIEFDGIYYRTINDE